jgi:predicted Zn-dependent peptidase
VATTALSAIALPNAPQPPHTLLLLLLFRPTFPHYSIPALTPARNLPSPRLAVTTLPNGFRVATQETYGQAATVALFVDAGSRYEDERQVGACHFLETLAFRSTAKRSNEDILAFCQAHGIR